MLGSLLTFFAVGLVTLIVAGIVLSVVGVVFSLTFGLATFLLFKVAPVLLVGWIVVKLVQKSSSAGTLSEADRKWLARLQGVLLERLGDTAFGVADMADAMNTDRTTLFRRTRQLLSLAPSELLRQSRLAAAARLLASERTSSFSSPSSCFNPMLSASRRASSSMSFWFKPWIAASATPSASTVAMCLSSGPTPKAAWKS